MWSILILLLLPKLHRCVEEMGYIPKDYVDPHDMRNYDRATKSMKKPYTTSDTTFCSVSETPQLFESHLTDEKHRLEIFMERFINRLLQSANLKDRIMRPGTKIVTEIPVSITAEELEKLASLGHGFKSSDLNELDRLLSLVLSYERGFTFNSIVSYFNPIEELFFNMSVEKAAIMICISIASVTVWMFAVGKSYKKIMLFLYLLCFMGGLAFNAWHMYMEAVSEQIAESQRFMTIPDVCNPRKTSWWSFLFSWRNECLEFQRSIRINPLSKVSPSIVFSHTLSTMFTHPLKELGARVGDFIYGVSCALPAPLNYLFVPFVLIIFCIVFLLIIMSQMGASFNCWTLFGGVSIKLDESKNTKSQEALMNEIKNIKKFITSEIKVTQRLEAAGDAGRITTTDQGNIASYSHLYSINGEKNLPVQNTNIGTNEAMLGTFNIFKVDRKIYSCKSINPNSIRIRKRYK